MRSYTPPPVATPPTLLERVTSAALLACVLSALALSSPGCGGASASDAAPADPARARQVLRDALDAWRRGDAHDRTAAGVRVADEDWLAGKTLVSYDLRGDGQAVGQRYRCPVVLTLRDPRGKAVKRTVLYEVGTDPEPSVIRHDQS